MNAEDLLDLKERITQAKDRKSELTGQKKTLVSQLEKTYGVKTPAEAKNKARTLTEEINTLTKKIEAQTTELETILHEQDQSTEE